MIEQRRGPADNRPGMQDYRRYLASMIARAATDDPEAFAQVVGLLDEARAQLPAAAAQLRQGGYSWADLARPLGVTRQTAFERFGASKAAQRQAAALAAQTETLFDNTEGTDHD